VYGSSSLATTIRWNYLTTNFRGIFIYGAGSNPLGTLIYGNLVANNRLNGIDQFQTNAAANPTLVYNNTVIHNPSSATGDRAGHGIDIQDIGSDGISIENNIIYSAYSGTNVNVQLINLSSSISMTNVTVNHNLYFLASGSTANVAQDTSSVTYATLALWQTYLNTTTYSGKDANSVSGDPLFTNYGGGVFTLQSGSPAINAAANLGVTYIQALNPTASWPTSVTLLPQSQNNSGWDIGAYIFTEHCVACDIARLLWPEIP
jgi:hypothetical protein